MPESRRGAPPVSAAAAKVLFNKYELGRLLGRGATAKVYHARNLHTGHSVAIKCIPKPRATNNAGAGPSAGPSPAIIEREVSIMRRLRHPHILRLLEVLASRTKIYFVLELAKGGELFDHLAASSRLSETQSRLYFHQLISAVHYCHARGVFHRDLKPENLLLDDAGELKVSDFGLSSDAATPDLLQTLCGTPAYVAPEILAKKGYSGAAVDVWSCGVVLFVLTAGYLPFNDTNLMAMYRKIYKGQYRCPRWTSPELRRLISRLLDTNPLTRITVDEIVDDPWFRKGFDEVKWASMKRGFDDKVKMVTEEDERELNAFDLISYSSGLDLNRLFGEGDQERFVTAGDVVARLEELAEEERVVVRRVVGGAVVEERGTGSAVARVVVRRLTEEMVVVEVAGGEVWREKMRLMLNGVADTGAPAA